MIRCVLILATCILLLLPHVGRGQVIDDWDPLSPPRAAAAPPPVRLHTDFDSSPLGDGKTFLTRVTLVGDAPAGMEVRVTPPGVTTISSERRIWQLDDVELVPGRNEFKVEFLTGPPTIHPFGLEHIDTPRDADLVRFWTAFSLDVIREQRLFPTVSSRMLAMHHLAMYEAANKAGGRYESWLGDGENDGPGVHPALAANEAARVILSELYPTISRRAELHAAHLAEAVAPDATTAMLSAEAGRQAARAILERRARDGARRAVVYIPGKRPGDWRPSRPAFRPPLDPHWGNLTPFAISGVGRYELPPPPTLDSVKYAHQVAEVTDLGSYTSTVRTSEETMIARFWSGGLSTSGPPGYWNRIAAQLTERHGFDTIDTARTLALVNLAMVDAGIVCWHDKYRHDFWRPIHAIHLAHLDGNPATGQNAQWSPLLSTPPFPDYPSGHSVFSGAAATVLDSIFPDDSAFTLESDRFPETFRLPDIIRSFPNVIMAAREASWSRVLGGIHFRFACELGFKQGTRIGETIAATQLAPTPGAMTASPGKPRQ